MTSEATSQDRLACSRLVLGAMATHALGTALRLAVPDQLGEAPRGVEEVAAACSVPEQTMRRLLRALAALGVCVESEPGRFALSSMGSLLRRDHAAPADYPAREGQPGGEGHPGGEGQSGREARPNSMYAFARMFTDPVMLAGWRHLDQCVRTGESSFESEFGRPFFEHLATEPELSVLFNASMAQGSAAVAGVLPDSYPFADYHTLVDIGGGNGALLAAVLATHPDPHGIVFDTEAGLAEAPANLVKAGLSDRVAVQVGDFFSEVPAGADLYLMKSVLHDWDDERAGAILRRCRTALAPGGRVLVVEPVLPEVVPPDSAPVGVYLSDLNMLVNLGGRERTSTDFERLFGTAGLELLSVTELPGGVGFCLLEGASSAG